MNPEIEARKVIELVDGGMSMEEAVKQVLEEVKKRVVITDRVEWIKGLDTVAEVRKALKSAHGKKSKATTPEKKAKYQEEVDTANKRMNELMADVYKAENPLKVMLEMGEEPRKVLHHWLRDKEAELKERLVKTELSKNKIKALVASQDPSTPKVVVDELAKVHADLPKLWEERVSRLDQGVIAVNRKVRLLNK